MEDATSIRAYGVRERVISYPDTRDVGTITSRLRRELERSAAPALAMSLTLVNRDNVFGAFVEGDTVWIEAGSQGLRGSLRVKSRALDYATRTMAVAGEYEAAS